MLLLFLLVGTAAWANEVNPTLLPRTKATSMSQIRNGSRYILKNANQTTRYLAYATSADACTYTATADEVSKGYLFQWTLEENPSVTSQFALKLSTGDYLAPTASGNVKIQETPSYFVVEAVNVEGAFAGFSLKNVEKDQYLVNTGTWNTAYSSTAPTLVNDVALWDLHMLLEDGYYTMYNCATDNRRKNMYNDMANTSNTNNQTLQSASLPATLTNNYVWKVTVNENVLTVVNGQGTPLKANNLVSYPELTVKSVNANLDMLFTAYLNASNGGQNVGGIPCLTTWAGVDNAADNHWRFNELAVAHDFYTVEIVNGSGADMLTRTATSELALDGGFFIIPSDIVPVNTDFSATAVPEGFSAPSIVVQDAEKKIVVRYQSTLPLSRAIEKYEAQMAAEKAGTNVGAFTDQKDIDDANAAIALAKTFLSDEEGAPAALEALETAMADFEAKRIVPTAGMTYVFENIYKSGGATKYAMYSDGSDLRWAAEDLAKNRTYWTLEAVEGGFKVKNGDGRYVGATGDDFIMTDASHALVTTFNRLSGDIYNINFGGKSDAHTNGHSGISGNIIAFENNALTNNASIWNLKPISGYDMYAVSATMPLGYSELEITRTATSEKAVAGGFFVSATGTALEGTEFTGSSVPGYTPSVAVADNALTLTYAPKDAATRLAEILAVNNGFVRLYSGRNHANVAYQNGNAMKVIAGNAAGTTSYSQIWQIEVASEGGYKIRNARTGMYVKNLTTTYTPHPLGAEAGKFYISNSSATTLSDYFCISNSENFSGHTCFHDDNNSQVVVWSAGATATASAWQILPATDIDMDVVSCYYGLSEALLPNGGLVRITSDQSNAYVVADGEDGHISMEALDENDPAQIWVMGISENDYTFTNFSTGKHIDRTSGTHGDMPTTTSNNPTKVVAAATSTPEVPMYTFLYPSSTTNSWYYSGEGDQLQVAAMADKTAGIAFKVEAANDARTFTIHKGDATTVQRKSSGDFSNLLTAEDGANAVAICTGENIPEITVANVGVNGVWSSLVLADDADFDAGENSYTAKNVTYSRTLYAGWNTLCLPFAFSASDLPENCKVELFKETREEAGEMVLVFEESTEVPAGVPCLVHNAAGADATWNLDKADAEGIAFVGRPTVDDAAAYYINGSFTEKTIGAGHYKMNNVGDAFGQTSDAGKTFAFRAYVSPTAAEGAAALRVLHGAGTLTGIGSVDNGELTIDNGIYDLSGRRVENPAKGEIYIIGGQKVMFK